MPIRQKNNKIKNYNYNIFNNINIDLNTINKFKNFNNDILNKKENILNIYIN